MASNDKIIDVCDVLRGDKVIDFYMMFFFMVIRLMELRCVNAEAAALLLQECSARFTYVILGPAELCFRHKVCNKTA
jgi:hypothetical protein